MNASDVFMNAMNKEDYKKFIEKLLLALRLGFTVTDESEHYSRPIMSTVQAWQALLWSLLYPGQIYMLISAINVNASGITITWRLIAKEYHSLKDCAFKIAEQLNKDALLGFIFTAILGDGTVDIKHIAHGNVEPVIYITMSSSKFDKWKPVINRLDIKWWGLKTKDRIFFFSSNAIDLARSIINVLPPVLSDILDTLKIKKWINLKQIARMEMKFKIGENQVNIANVKFTVNIHKSTIELIHKARNENEIKEIVEILRNIYGENFAINMRKSSKYLVIAIPAYVFEKYEDIRKQVIQVIYRKLEKTKDEKKRQIMIKYLSRLTS